MRELQGGDFLAGAGFSAAGANTKDITMAAITIAGGGVAGGITESVMGGNFWNGERGKMTYELVILTKRNGITFRSHRNVDAVTTSRKHEGMLVRKTGLIVAGLNHAAHAIAQEARVNRELREAGILNPKEQAPFEGKSIGKVLKAETLKNMYARSSKPSFVLDEGLIGSSGQVGEIISGNKIQVWKGAFSSYRYLALTIGHELVHIQQWNLGLMAKWYAKYDNINMGNAFSEIDAYQFSLDYGGENAFYRLQLNKYKNMFK